jgi:hypothetical protein
MLITRYPGIRRIFTRHEKFKQFKSQGDVLKIWHSGEMNSQEWTLFSEFAAFTMMGNGITDEVENLPPSQLARLGDMDRTLFDFLTSRCYG